jgi:hypothetical protein
VLANFGIGTLVWYVGVWESSSPVAGVVSMFARTIVLLLALLGEPVMAATCYDSRPGDRDHWPLRLPGPVAGASELSWPWRDAAPHAASAPRTR